MSDECPSCGFEPLEPRKTVEGNEVSEDGWYCPGCEGEYDDLPTHWDDQDFPLWIEWESYNDTYGLLRSLEHQSEAHHETIPDEFGESGSPFKYTVFTVWFKVTANGNVGGPYDEKRGELI